MTGGGTADPGCVRLFFAAVPDGVAARHLEEAGRALSAAQAVRRVSPVNHHLTVAFAGSVPLARLPELVAIGRAHATAGFSLHFDAYEYWPKPEVIVARARCVPAALERLWQGLHRDLAARGWAPDPKRLRPHVTLARKVTQPPVSQAMSPFDWCVQSLSLLRSDTGGAASVYTVVDTWPLLYDAEKHWKSP